METKRSRQSVETRCKCEAHTPNPFLNSLLIGTLKPPAYSFAFDEGDKVTDKARDKVDKSPEGVFGGLRLGMGHATLWMNSIHRVFSDWPVEAEQRYGERPWRTGGKNLAVF